MLEYLFAAAMVIIGALGLVMVAGMCVWAIMNLIVAISNSFEEVKRLWRRRRIG